MTPVQNIVVHNLQTAPSFRAPLARRMEPDLRTVSLLLVFCLLTGCAAYSSRQVAPTPIVQAKAEIPETQLLDVGILVFESKELDPKDAKKEGTNAEIRKAESHFIPYHLKNTLHQSSHWGAVQVIPAATDSVDLTVGGKILSSNGEHLVLAIEAKDATGKKWLKKTYRDTATASSYTGNQPGQKEPYQNLYNTIANDLAAFKLKLTAADIKTIRTVAQLKYAQTFAPDAFAGYLIADKNKPLRINRLPAADDPMMARLLQIREREYMYVDTLNQQYEDFYNQMWPSYENWRKLNQVERDAIKKIKKEAFTKQLLGALLIAGAVAIGSSSDSDTARVVTPAMIVIGGQVFISGWNVSKDARMHSAAIEELSESFGAQMQPVTVQFEGKQYELTGSAEEQFAQWKTLLRQIYFAETGFGPAPPVKNTNQ